MGKLRCRAAQSCRGRAWGRIQAWPLALFASPPSIHAGLCNQICGWLRCPGVRGVFPPPLASLSIPLPAGGIRSYLEGTRQAALSSPTPAFRGGSRASRTHGYLFAELISPGQAVPAEGTISTFLLITALEAPKTFGKCILASSSPMDGFVRASEPVSSLPQSPLPRYLIPLRYFNPAQYVRICAQTVLNQGYLQLSKECHQVQWKAQLYRLKHVGRCLQNQGPAGH